MKKEFTQEDILKKHETNIKSASTAILLSGVLGLIYVVRYIFSGNLDFYFGLSFTDLLIRLGENKGSTLIPIIISVAYILIFTSLAVFSNKCIRLISVGLGIYIFDSLCLIYSLIFLFPKPLDSALFIDAFVHLFVITFLIVGIISGKKIKK